jgi:hypothetical protein
MRKQERNFNLGFPFVIFQAGVILINSCGQIHSFIAYNSFDGGKDS